MLAESLFAPAETKISSAEISHPLALDVYKRQVLDSDYDEDAANQIFLDGYICKEAIYRKMCIRDSIEGDALRSCNEILRSHRL